MKFFPNNFYYQTEKEWLLEFLKKIDFEALHQKSLKTIAYRETHPDWERPVVMYGVRKMTHKWVKKQEIAVIIDKMPWLDRARMAETHWFIILHKRPATDLEWKEVSGEKYNRRYVIWSYFLDKRWTVDKTVSHIVQDDSEEYGVDTKEIIAAFEKHFARKIRIYRRENVRQLTLF